MVTLQETSGAKPQMIHRAGEQYAGRPFSASRYERRRPNHLSMAFKGFLGLVIAGMITSAIAYGKDLQYQNSWEYYSLRQIRGELNLGTSDIRYPQVVVTGAGPTADNISRKPVTIRRSSSEISDTVGIITLGTKIKDVIVKNGPNLRRADEKVAVFDCRSVQENIYDARTNKPLDPKPEGLCVISADNAKKVNQLPAKPLLSD